MGARDVARYSTNARIRSVAVGLLPLLRCGPSCQASGRMALGARSPSALRADGLMYSGHVRGSSPSWIRTPGPITRVWILSMVLLLPRGDEGGDSVPLKARAVPTGRQVG
mgnify:CR=1 FL=1